MPQLPNSPDVQTKNVDPIVNPVLPTSDGMAAVAKESSAPNFVESRVDLLPLVTPPSDFVSKRLDVFGKNIAADKKIDPDFERWLSQQTNEALPEIHKKEAEAKKVKFQSVLDSLNAEGQKQLEATTTAPRRLLKQAAIGALDAVNSAGQAAISLSNVSRKFFGVKELENIPDLTESFPEPKDNAERFVRSSAKFMTGMLPISRSLEAAVGITGVANTVAATGAYGFLFDKDKTDSVVNDFITSNIDLAPDVLKYMNHESSDSELITRLKNSAHYATDALAVEGIFHGLKVAKDLALGRENAHKVLSNGDVLTTAKDVTKDQFAEKPTGLKLKGLTTEETSGKSTADILQEKVNAAYENVQGKYIMKQNANPDRMVQGRLEALAAIKKDPMTLDQLLKIPENAPVNNQTIMQAEIASSALNSYGKDLLKQATEGKTDKSIVLFKLSNIADKLDKLAEPRSTAGRALESAKFISSLEEADKLPVKTLKAMEDKFGHDAERIIEEVRLTENNLSGFPIADSVMTAMRKNVDPKKVYKYINSARINWILSDPTVHTANILSNAMVTGVRSATEVAARGVTLGRGIFGNQYLAKGVGENEARASVKGYMQGMGKALSIIGENIGTLVEEKSLYSNKFKPIYSRDSNTKYNKAIDQIIEESDLANNFEKASLGKQLAKTLGHTVAGTPVGKMLSFEDDFFKGMHYMAEVNKQLVIKENDIARNASQISDPELSKNYTISKMEEVAKIREGFKNGILDEEIDAKAMEAANYWTFNNDLVADDSVTKALSAGGKFVNEMPLLKWFVPFYRTGANIANMSMEYTPVLGGLLKMGNVGGVAGLMRGGAEADQFIAKQALGAGLMATTAIAIATLDENFGLDFKISSMKNNKVGLKVGEFETTIDKQNPIFKIMIATRDIMDIANVAMEDKGASAASQAASALLMEMYSPAQLIQVMGMMADLSNGQKNDIPAKLENMLKLNIISQVTPYSGAARFVQRDIVGMNKPIIGQESDETLLDEMVKRMKHIYLGDDANIPARRGLFGQEIPYLRTFGYAVSDNAHDMFHGYSTEDKTIKELLKLTKEDVMSNPQNYDQFELNNTTFLDMPGNIIALPSGEQYKLTPAEHSAYVQAAAGEHPMFGGKTLKSTLDNFITSSEYSNLPTKYKIVAIKKIVNLYRKVAKGIMLKDNYDISMEAKTSLLNLKTEFINVGK